MVSSYIGSDYFLLEQHDSFSQMFVFFQCQYRFCCATNTERLKELRTTIPNQHLLLVPEENISMFTSESNQWNKKLHVGANDNYCPKRTWHFNCNTFMYVTASLKVKTLKHIFQDNGQLIPKPVNSFLHSGYSLLPYQSNSPTA